jgi:hypothetical protein
MHSDFSVFPSLVKELPDKRLHICAWELCLFFSLSII